MSATVQAPIGRLQAQRARSAIGRLSTEAWIAAGTAAAFIAVTCWWVSKDKSVPVYDAGVHLETAIQFYEQLKSGDLLGPFNHISQYPPLGHLVGAVAMLVTGAGVSPPIIAENLVFVPLLALGVYQAGRLLFGARAGLLAVVFVLGSPLLIAQLHVFMLDAPEAAVVAVSIWLLLASERFGRVGLSAAAGLAVGCALLVKVTVPFFLAGIVLVALARGGWRNWRGLLAFALLAALVGAPWYIDHLSELRAMVKLGGSEPGGAPPGNILPIWSRGNWTWYAWSTLNSQLLAPLFCLMLAGTAWTAAAVLRKRPSAGPRLELLAGLFAAWLAITVTPHHDIRYDIPLMPYLAVLGAGWIVFLPRRPMRAATAVLIAAVAANTLGTTFGVGQPVEVDLASPPANTEALPQRVVLYSNQGFLVAGPQRDGDTLGLLEAMRRDGVSIVTFTSTETTAPDFSFEGLLPLTKIAKVMPATATGLVQQMPSAVRLLHQSPSSTTPPVCARLSDGTAVWVQRRDPHSGRVAFYCPLPRPRYYAQRVV